MHASQGSTNDAARTLDRLGSEFDLVVVGSGAGSICAALVAKTFGRSCVVLEKQAKVGGSTAISGGVLWTPVNPLMAEEGIPDSYTRARRYFDAVVTYEGPGTSPERREAFLKVGPPMIEFLRAHGMQFFRPEGWCDYYDDRPGGEPRSRCLMAPLYDARALGPWANKLARSPVGAGMPVHSHELPLLYLAKRTWKGRWMALRLAGRIARMKLTGADLVSNGAAIQGRMLEIALREGIPIVPEAPVRDLVVEGGRVVGVRVACGGDERIVRARGAVLLNAGGFSRSQALRERFGPAPTAAQWTAANPGDTGEIVESAMRLGAAIDAMDAFWWVPTTQGLDGRWPEGTTMPDGTLAPWTHHLDLSLPYSIVVDRRGERYLNESASYMEVGERMHERHRTHGSAIPSFVVFDGLHRKWYPWGTALPGVTPKAWLESGYMKKADTLAELARQCGIDPDGLAKTVERWNGFCRTGVDADFQRGGRCFDRAHGDVTVRPNPNLGPISTPPFYAVPMVPSDVGTAGGLVTDAWSRVLREDGRPIEGLYATGNTTASVMGRTYPGAGASIAAAFTFAYIAAHHAFGEARRIDAILAGEGDSGGRSA
ncbi:MAG: FAD-binding protein [Myxococcota bacterium]